MKTRTLDDQTMAKARQAAEEMYGTGRVYCGGHHIAVHERPATKAQPSMGLRLMLATDANNDNP
jgi:hypothetical protein